MEHLAVIFGLWLVWNLALVWFSTPDWFWSVLAIVVGCAAELLIEPSTWWYGFGVAGAAAFVMLIGDLLLVTADSIRTQVVRNAQHRR